MLSQPGPEVFAGANGAPPRGTGGGQECQYCIATRYTEPRYNHGMPLLSPQAFHILVALAERDQHGYGIMQDVAERTGGKLRLSAGTLYGSIKRLLEQGLIVELRESQRPEKDGDDERRRYYRLTPMGRKAAKEEVRRMAELVEQARAHGLVAKPN
jgi:DNA-binding PadR family transcriptional regulator